MSRESISIIQLEYAVALDTHRNFSKAAEFCHVTQPTLSIQFKKLENSLGVVLFDRSRNPIIPTEFGVVFLQRARRILRELNQLSEEVNFMKEDISGEISIGVIPTIAPYLVPAFIGEFAQQYPEVKIRVEEMLTYNIVKELEKDKLDVGLIIGPMNSDAIEMNPLFYEEIQVYLNSSHPLLENSELDIWQLQSKELWVLGKGHCFRDQILNLCTLRNEENSRNIRYESGSLDTLKRLVDVEGGFTLVPELAVNTLSAEEKNRIRRIKGVKPLREVCLATARTFCKSKMIDLLAAFISESVPKSMLQKDRGRVVEWQS